MLPGTLCDARLYAPVVERLGLPATIPALAGAETAAALAQLILAAAPERFSLCGFSLGAIVALEIVAQAPERVERLALIGCNPGVLDSKARAARAASSATASLTIRFFFFFFFHLLVRFICSVAFGTNLSGAAGDGGVRQPVGPTSPCCG